MCVGICVTIMIERDHHNIPRGTGQETTDTSQSTCVIYFNITSLIAKQNKTKNRYIMKFSLFGEKNPISKV